MKKENQLLKTQEYNGRSNRSTWLLGLWIDNDYNLQEKLDNLIKKQAERKSFNKKELKIFYRNCRYIPKREKEELYFLSHINYDELIETCKDNFNYYLNQND